MSRRPLATQLSTLDASFLHIETPEAPLHLGGVDVFDGPVSRAGLMARLAGRMDEIPRYRQRVVEAPLGLGNPFWEDAPAFDLNEHILEATLPPPGDEASLKRLAARIFEPLLPRDRPLWQLHVVNSLAGGRSAIVSKIHHAMVDGISGVELLDVLFDVTPDGRTPSIPAPARMLESEPAIEAGGLLERGLEVARALARAAAEPVIRLPFNRALTGSRRISWATMPLGEVRALRAAAGGTLNDVVLAFVTDAVGRWLRECGETIGGRYLRLMVPVNVRRADEAGTLGNRVSMVPVEVPFDGDPLERLRFVQARTDGLKRAHLASAVEQIASVSASVPAPIVAALLSLAARPAVLAWSAPLRNLPPLTTNVVCTNVPGPRVPLYAQGRRLVAHYPLVPLAFEFGLSFAIFSYAEHLSVGLVADGGVVDDLEPLARHVERAFAALRAAASVPEVPADADPPHAASTAASSRAARKPRSPGSSRSPAAPRQSRRGAAGARGRSGRRTGR